MSHRVSAPLVLLMLALPWSASAGDEPVAPAGEPAPAAAEADQPAGAPAVLDCPAALDRFEQLVQQTIEALGQQPADPARLAPLQDELAALDNRAGRMCLRYYTRGIELYGRLREAEARAGVAHLLAETLPPPELPPDRKPHRPHYDVEVKEFDKPILGTDRPAICIAAPLRPESGLVVGIAGIALGSAIGISLLQFDGQTERGIGYGFLFAAGIFSPSAGHFQAEDQLGAWLWIAGRAAASALSIAGFAKATGDEETDRWMGYSGAAGLGLLAVAGLVHGVLTVNKINDICAPPGEKTQAKQGSTALLYLPRLGPAAPTARSCKW